MAHQWLKTLGKHHWLGLGLWETLNFEGKLKENGKRSPVLKYEIQSIARNTLKCPFRVDQRTPMIKNDIVHVQLQRELFCTPPKCWLQASHLGSAGICLASAQWHQLRGFTGDLKSGSQPVTYKALWIDMPDVGLTMPVPAPGCPDVLALHGWESKTASWGSTLSSQAGSIWCCLPRISGSATSKAQQLHPLKG